MKNLTPTEKIIHRNWMRLVNLRFKKILGDGEITDDDKKEIEKLKSILGNLIAEYGQIRSPRERKKRDMAK